MKKIAVFGNAGGGKSTLSKKLAAMTGLPLYILDKIKYQAGGAEVPLEDYQRLHQDIITTDRWIIDGFGSIDTVWLRLEQADTLIFVDLPIHRHSWWVTKRLITGFFKPPEGWPDHTPILKGSLNSYRALWLCHKYLTPKYREYVEQAQKTKRVYHLRSTAQIAHIFALIDHASNVEEAT